MVVSWSESVSSSSGAVVSVPASVSRSPPSIGGARAQRLEVSVNEAAKAPLFVR